MQEACDTRTSIMVNAVSGDVVIYKVFIFLPRATTIGTLIAFQYTISKINGMIIIIKLTNLNLIFLKLLDVFNFMQCPKSTYLVA